MPEKFGGESSRYMVSAGTLDQVYDDDTDHLHQHCAEHHADGANDGGYGGGHGDQGRYHAITQTSQMAMTATTIRRQSTKMERMNIRTTVERKAFYERAADIKGIPLTAFVEQALNEVAKRVIAEFERNQLTARDCRFLMDLLRNPAPEPTPVMLKAAEDLKASQAAKD